MAARHKKILIIGGGTAGITTAAHLIRAGAGANQIAIIEPSTRHFYQPIWTLVGGGVVRKEVSASVDTSKPAIGGRGKPGHRAGAQGE